MKLQPLADRVVAKSIEAENKTAAGIFIPDSAKEKPQMAEVTGVGKDVKEIKVGDRILHSGGYDVKKVKVDGVELLILKEEDVLAVAK